MQRNTGMDSDAWLFFTRVSFVTSIGMVGTGIVLLPIDLALKGFLGIGMLMLVQSSIILTKTLRDAHEASKLIHRLDEARTEELLTKGARA